MAKGSLPRFTPIKLVALMDHARRAVPKNSGVKLVPNVGIHMLHSLWLATRLRITWNPMVAPRIGGDVAILWHHRVFHPETNWGGLYKDILEYIMVDDGTDS